MDMIRSEQFEELMNNGTAFIADFYADWCGPCRMLAPLLDKLAGEHPDVAFVKVNVDDEPALAARFGIDAIPCIIRFDGGAETGRSIGYVTEDPLKKRLHLG